MFVTQQKSSDERDINQLHQHGNGRNMENRKYMLNWFTSSMVPDYLSDQIEEVPNEESNVESEAEESDDPHKEK